MKTINEEILLEELKSWVSKYKSGRDDNDQRFGQHIWNNYDLDAVFPERDGGSDGFNEEDPHVAFAIIYNKLIEKKVMSEDRRKIRALLEGLDIQNIDTFMEKGKVGDYRKLGEAYRAVKQVSKPMTGKECSLCHKHELTVRRDMFDGMCVRCTDKALYDDEAATTAAINNRRLIQANQ